MSIIFQSNGTTTGSTAFATITLRDAMVGGEIYSDQQNVAYVTGDGGYEYAYERGEIKAGLSYGWTLLPLDTTAGLDGLRGLRDVFEATRGTGWFTFQPTHIEDKAIFYSTGTGTTAYLSVNHTPGGGGTAVLSVPMILKAKGAWVLVLTGASAGVKRRIVQTFTTGPQISSAISIAQGDQMLIGYPVRITSPFAPRRVGNRDDFFSIDLQFNVVF